MWEVRKSYYMTYAEIEASGVPFERCGRQEVIRRFLSLEKALALVDQLGFGYSAHPQI